MATERQHQHPSLSPVKNIEVYATHVDVDMAVRTSIGDAVGSGAFSRYLSPQEARAYAAALIAAADFYDAETARLAAEAEVTA